MREDVHVGLYIASLVALIPAIIIFFSYKYVIKNMQFPEKYPEKYGHSEINDQRRISVKRIEGNYQKGFC